MLTTTEAAKILGISTRRIVALIHSGDLEASRFGRSWMIKDASVAARKDLNRSSGRPIMDEKDPRALSRYTLMNRDHAVIDFTFDRKTHRVGSIAIREGIDWKPLGIGPIDGKPSKIDLAEWISARSIPHLRPNLAPVMRALSASSSAELMFWSLGLSLSDQYWFKPDGAELSWHDVNYFANGYQQDFGRALIDGSAIVAPLQRTPDVSTSGMLAKTWIRRNGIDYLIKAGMGSDNREPYNEALATKLLHRMMGEDEFVPYELVEHRGRTYSSCPCMVTSETELVSAADVLTGFRISGGHDVYAGYIGACESLGIKDVRQRISKMIVADFIMANFDRHTHNFGIIRNVETRDEWRIAPLYDQGCGFYARATAPELEHGRYLWESCPFSEYPSQQLSLAEDFSWYDPSALDGFSDDIADVLSLNPAIDDRFIELVQAQTARQIERVNDVAAERIGVYPGF